MARPRCNYDWTADAFGVGKAARAAVVNSLAGSVPTTDWVKTGKAWNFEATRLAESQLQPLRGRDCTGFGVKQTRGLFPLPCSILILDISRRGAQAGVEMLSHFFHSAGMAAS